MIKIPNMWSEVKNLGISIMINSDDNPLFYAKSMMPKVSKLYCCSNIKVMLWSSMETFEGIQIAKCQMQEIDNTTSHRTIDHTQSRMHERHTSTTYSKQQMITLNMMQPMLSSI
jgi:hypothetical protein